MSFSMELSYISPRAIGDCIWVSVDLVGFIRSVSHLSPFVSHVIVVSSNSCFLRSPDYDINISVQITPSNDDDDKN